MKSLRALGVLSTLLCGLLVSGCATAMSPVWGLYTDVKGPLQATAYVPGSGGQARGSLPAGSPQDPQFGADQDQRFGAGTAPTTTATAMNLKTGAATATSILGIVATGDASIEAAAKNGGITRIHHVDHHSRNIFGFYSEFTTIVYGE